MLLTFSDFDSRLLSGKLWRGFAPPSQWNTTDQTSGNPAFGFLDDFHSFNATTLDGPYASLVTAGGSLALAADTATDKGVLAASLAGDTQEDEVILKRGGTLSAPIKLADKDLCFEARIAVSAITAAKWNLGIGLGQADMIVTDKFFTDADALADVNFLGFNKLAPEGAAWDAAYKADGQTYQNGATKTKLDSLHTAVADTFVKVGFRYHAHPKKVEFFVDNSMPGGNVTPARLTTMELDAATFPDDVLLAPIFGIKDSAGDAALTAKIDWWACAQYL